MGGIFLSFVMLAPVGKWDFDSVTAFTQAFEHAAEAATDDGLKMAAEAERDIIQEEVSAYILDKATQLRMELTVDVVLSDGIIPVPESVKVTGSAPPFAKGQLQRIIEMELGIPKERQIWIG